jgi:hypothetical protein
MPPAITAELLRLKQSIRSTEKTTHILDKFAAGYSSLPLYNNADLQQQRQ